METVLVFLALFGWAGAGEAQTRRWDFEKAALGKLPAGWTAAQTGVGKGSVWKVVQDRTAPKGSRVLAQTAESPDRMFNLCVADKTRFKDVEVTVAFKAVKGMKDQGGGIVWRYQNGKNYYLARLNPLEDNYRLYKIVNGKRTQLKTREGLKVPAGEWHTLTIKHQGDQIECSLDGKMYLKGKDNTFPNAGPIGLWTKADAQTYFDGVEVRELKE